MDFERIPHELRAYRQFCLWKYEEAINGKPTKVPYASTGYPLSVTDSSQWCSFEEALSVVHHADGIGFVLSPNDPYTFIDLDEPKQPNGDPLPPDEYEARMEKQRLIYSEFNSYSELSPSGKGLHIIVKGKVEAGRRRDNVEVYSDMRFMTMTGNVFNDAPIMDRQETLKILWEQMGKGRAANLYYAGLEKAQYTNDQVLAMAASASNAEKFHDLYTLGHWHKYYPSQSEADFALIDILAFYSKNRAQVQNLFLSSMLGQRDKSRVQYRVNRLLDRCFDNLLPPVDLEGLRNQVNEAIERQKKQTRTSIQIDEEKAYQNLPDPEEFPEDLDSIYVPPKGLLGEIAEYIYAQAPLPVPEIALAGAIGLMSGIIGKAYNVSATGLNQYTLVLAATGTGKESAAQGIAKLMTEVTKSCPSAGDFVGASSIASPQALTKALQDNPCFVSIVGEFGLHLQQMASPAAPAHMQGVKSMLLDLYNKSGEGAKLGKLIYSDREKNTAVVSAPSFSMLGESAPEPFYEALDESMISGGLLPRFTIIEYKGDRVKRNKGAALAKPSNDLVRNLATLCSSSLNLINQRKVVQVQYTEEAEKLLDAIDDDCAKRVMGAIELKRQLWTRVHLKVLRLAAMVAVGVNPYQPTIDADAVLWARRIIYESTIGLNRRFESGEVGVNNEENKQIKTLSRVINKYLTDEWESVRKIIDPKFQNLHKERVIPYAYLQRSCSNSPAFKNDRLGATTALKRTLSILQARGDLQQMGRAELHTKFGTSSECYVVSSPMAFGLA